MPLNRTKRPMTNIFLHYLTYAFAKCLAEALDGFNLSSVHKQGSKEKISAEPGFEPGAAGLEAKMRSPLQQ